MTHTHPCTHCHTPVECDGERERNEDGWPSVTCSSYHLPGGRIADVRCESCESEDAA